MNVTWTLSLLGAPTLMQAGQPAQALEGKSLALLAYLALEGQAPRAHLARLLWPDAPEPTARNNLVQTLRRLARTFGFPLVTGPDFLTLDPAVRVDVRALDVTDPGALSLEPLLRGTAFDDLPELAEWLYLRREQWTRQVMARLTVVADQHEAHGDLQGALQVAGRLLAVQPLSEETHRRVMRLHYLNGDRPAALDAFARCKALLRQDLDLEPSPATQHLALEISRQAPLPGASPSPALPLAVRRPPCLVGREAEWQQLQAAWDAGQFIVVSGDPGVGKTRLLQDFAAQQGAALRVVARPGDAVVPYATTARSLRQILADHPERTLSDDERHVLGTLLPDVLRAGETPVVDRARLHLLIQDLYRTGARAVRAIVYEDLQYADAASIEAGFVLISSAFPLGQPDGVPQMLCTVRRGELQPSTAQTFAELIHAGLAAQIDLGPLPDAAVTALIAQLDVPLSADLTRRLQRFVGGNPLYLLETVRHLLSQPTQSSDRLPITDRVGQLVDRRLGRLSPAALNVARAAAVVQSDFDIEVLAAVLNAPLMEVMSAWSELEAAQIVSGSDFTHDLIYEAVRRQMPEPVRLLLHRSAARALQAGPPGRVAMHWLLAEDPAEAVPHLLLAAAQALDVGREAEGRAFLAQATQAYHQRERAAGHGSAEA
ncbi:AAA family ATPase [Deinococcus radiotolerans]|uniref:Bacterial transcriptional activator domain-containing protein n=1 Tax=Deinococcus radiotolerans TaxID=1309407 RepID=A0ABQ2FRS1_9DEIO|nr:AAA family ATPase [Deinococcus radiotolerans]GGL19648.1 hypothetical protein GCM10010844_43290 [Deinococcus radiotolerans]